jgi:Methyl-CpG binding domain
MARIAIFQSNRLHGDERKSTRVPKVKVEYMEYMERLSAPLKPPVWLPKKEPKVKTLKQEEIKPAKQKVVNSKTATTSIKRRSIRSPNNVVTNAERAFKHPTPKGFQRIVVQRQKGSTAGNLDTYYLGPEGKKLRSKPDVAKYLALHGMTSLSINQFEFLCGLPGFEVVIGQQTVVKSPAAAAPIKLKTLSVRLENIDHLLLKPPVVSSADHEAEDLPKETHEEQLESEVAPTPESVDEELDPGQLNWQTVKLPRRCSPTPSPYKLIYEEPEINVNCWRLFTASIIIYYWKFNSFVHRYAHWLKEFW